MKKLTILSVVTASLLLIGCGQDKSAETKAEPAKAQSHQTESVADKAAKAVEATKEAASAAATKAVEATKEAASAAATKATEVAKEAKETATKAVESAKKAVSGNSAPAAYAKCAGCHGKDGKMKALGKSAVIAGQSKDELVKKIKEYKAGTRNVAGMGSLMKGQVAGLSDADVDAIATYLSGLK